MLYTLVVLLVLFWLIGLIFHILGAFIHFFLVVAVLVLLYRLLIRRNAK